MKIPYKGVFTDIADIILNSHLLVKAKMDQIMTTVRQTKAGNDPADNELLFSLKIIIINYAAVQCVCFIYGVMQLH